MKNLLIIIAFIGVVIHSTAQGLDLGTAINKAGRQRMLVQKMTKDYMAIGLNIKKEESTKDIDEVTALFNENLNELKEYSKNDATTQSITIVSDLWTNYRMKMAYEPNVINAESIVEESLRLTKACNVVVEKIQDYSANSANKLTNMCGKQRMNLQKIAMLYLAKAWGVKYSYLDKELSDAVFIFDSNLTSLINAKENTEEIKTGLKFQQSEWQFLRRSFDIGVPKPTNIISSTNLMTKEFDKLTAMYGKLIIEKNNFSIK
ncbi:type IV pili methyl-accepting chemotaxis transducer N-terminal domain-containing protein [Flavobacterium sp.]|uniref:type IV pili methyl-accepting chemotaxis transducer N-terminal domain-containing protein n=1 Tax=Flavobacterium sp. TaxID=239 RepID=UPI00286DAC57|nr:type IV pili methyl-accepting chemotaxis transducer N-terminal domain-containing protein [Flavobacterium sp.]